MTPSVPLAGATVIADFIEDLRLMLAAKLAADGYKVEADATAATLLAYDLQVRHRRIERRPRHVVWSAELRARKSDLRAAPVTGEPSNANHGTVLEALERIEAAVLAGDDLNLYASRDLAPSSPKALTRGDWMLNDSGMHHLHMGIGFNGRGQVNGTKEVVFVLVRDDALYFVEVFAHPAGSVDRVCWADERAFQIAQSNWPELFEHAKVRGVAHQSLSHSVRTTLYKQNGNALLTASDGTPYFQPGGGSTPSGRPVNATIELDKIWSRLEAWEQWCKANGELLATELEARGRPRPSSLNLRLHEIEASGTVVVVVDTAASVSFRLAPPT